MLALAGALEEPNAAAWAWWGLFTITSTTAPYLKRRCDARHPSRRWRRRRPPRSRPFATRFPRPTDTKPLPPLKESDPEVRQSLIGVFGAKAVAQFLVPENVVRHIVVTVDNLPRKKVAIELRPMKPTPGATATATQGDVTTLGAANFERYAPLIKVVQNTDTKTLANVYFKLYPLFQQSYEDLGYPGQYFNDRLVEVIDDMLKTPDVQGPIELTQPKVFYEYADPKLEGLSSGTEAAVAHGTGQRGRHEGQAAGVSQGDREPAG